MFSVFAVKNRTKINTWLWISGKQFTSKQIPQSPRNVVCINNGENSSESQKEKSKCSETGQDSMLMFTKLYIKQTFTDICYNNHLDLNER